jgi:hypothetical protein
MRSFKQARDSFAKASDQTQSPMRAFQIDAAEISDCPSLKADNKPATLRCCLREWWKSLRRSQQVLAKNRSIL